MSGGVRNLRAMFEQNKDQSSTSPPQDRGRSPGSTGGRASSGTSPRPLSTIRTSFVTVEKSGQMGLQMRREPSGGSSHSKRRTSFSIDEGVVSEKEPLPRELDKQKNTSVMEVSILESAEEKPNPGAVQELGEKKKDSARLESAKVEPKKAAGTATSKPITSGKPAPAKSPEKSLTNKATSRPDPISTSKSTVAPKISPIKSSNAPKTPTTPRSRGRPEEKKTSDRNPEKKAGKASLPSSQPRKPSSQPATSKSRIGASPPQTGFVKPKPRSPTRPVKLPSSLTAHTASSGSKTTTSPPSRQSLSRASGNSQPTVHLQAEKALARSPTRVGATGTRPSALVRAKSTLQTSSRPSLGPPPSRLTKKPSRQSLPRESTQSDDGFLARMMRPTTSSASKTLITPAGPLQRAPSVKRPASRAVASKSHEASKAIPTVPKVSTTPAVSKPAVSGTKRTHAAVKKESPKAVEPVVVSKSEILAPPTSSVPLEISEQVPIVADEEVDSLGEDNNTMKVAEVGEPVKESASPVVTDKEQNILVEENAPAVGDKVPDVVDEKEDVPVEEDAPDVEGKIPSVLDKEQDVLLNDKDAPAMEVKNPGAEETLAVKEAIPVVEVSEESSPVVEESEVKQPYSAPEIVNEIPPTTVEPPTPVEEQHFTQPESHVDVLNTEEAKDSSPESEEPVEVAPEVVRPIASPTPSESLESELEKKQSSLSSGADDIVKTDIVKPEIIEDPEDVKAREEIARLNEEFMKIAAE